MHEKLSQKLRLTKSRSGGVSAHVSSSSGRASDDSEMGPIFRTKKAHATAVPKMTAARTPRYCDRCSITDGSRGSLGLMGTRYSKRYTSEKTIDEAAKAATIVLARDDGGIKTRSTLRAALSHLMILDRCLLLKLCNDGAYPAVYVANDPWPARKKKKAISGHGHAKYPATASAIMPYPSP